MRVIHAPIRVYIAKNLFEYESREKDWLRRVETVNGFY